MHQPDPVPPPQPPTPGGEPTSCGLTENVGGALSYLLGPITGVIFLLWETKSSFIRFHAAQSIGIFVVFFVVSMLVGVVTAVLTAIPILGWLFGLVFFLASILVGVAVLGLWLFLMYRALAGDEWEFPWIGEQSRRIILEGRRPG